MRSRGYAMLRSAPSGSYPTLIALRAPRSQFLGYNELLQQGDAKTGERRITYEHAVVDPQPRSRADHAHAARGLKPPVGLAVRVEDCPVALQRLERARLSVSGEIRRRRYEDAATRREPMRDEAAIANRIVADHRVESP